MLFSPKSIYHVFTGEVRAIKNNGLLYATGIGSCIVVAAYDSKNKVGGMAHIMLPGKAPEDINNFKYAENALEELLRRIEKKGALYKNLVFSYVGAGNVLKKENDNICKHNIEYIADYFKKNHFNMVAKNVGQTLRRSAKLDVETGDFFMSSGDQNEKLLCKLNQMRS